MNANRSARGGVLVVGLGGLGCPASLALARAGVGDLTLMDPDRVEPTNLHRQLWFRDSDVGALKVEAAASRLLRTFPAIRVQTLVQSAKPENVDALLRTHAVAIDGTDDIATKFALSDAAMRTGTPVVYGGALRMEGQAMLLSQSGPCLRCLFEEPPGADLAATCARAGVLGSVAGVVGAMQALLAQSVLIGRAHPGQLFIFDGATLKQRRLIIQKRSDCACSRAAQPQACVDITREVCPMTYVRTKLKLESLSEGEVLEVLLTGKEPLASIPKSAREEGHEIVSLEPVDSSRWRLLIRKHIRS